MGAPASKEVTIASKYPSREFLLRTPSGMKRGVDVIIPILWILDEDDVAHGNIELLRVYGAPVVAENSAKAIYGQPSPPVN